MKAGGVSHTVAVPLISKTYSGREVMRRTKKVSSHDGKEKKGTLRVKIQGICQIYCKAHISSFQGLTAGWCRRMRCRWNRGEKATNLNPLNFLLKEALF